MRVTSFSQSLPISARPQTSPAVSLLPVRSFGGRTACSPTKDLPWPCRSVLRSHPLAVTIGLLSCHPGRLNSSCQPGCAQRPPGCRPLRSGLCCWTLMILSHFPQMMAVWTSYRQSTCDHLLQLGETSENHRGPVQNPCYPHLLSAAYAGQEQDL